MTCGGLGNQVSRMRTMMIVLYRLLQSAHQIMPRLHLINITKAQLNNTQAAAPGLL